MHRCRTATLETLLPAGSSPVKRDVTDRCLRLCLDLSLTPCRAAPRRHDETRASFHDLLEFVVGVCVSRVLLAERQGAREECLLNGLEQCTYVRGQPLHRRRRFLTRVAAREHLLRLLDVFRSDFQAQRNAAQFPLVVLPTWCLRVAVVEHEAHAMRHQIVFYSLTTG